jgi:ribonucleoside-diphosphate reductase alpha chain
MMAAVQPFLSGGISKTVNMPAGATADEIADAYLQGWKLGLKSLAIYRDGSKRTQPLNTKQDEAVAKPAAAAVAAAAPASAEPQPRRRKLSDVRNARTHKFSIAGHDGYITVGLYEDGTPGEVFLKMAKEGSTISGLMDSIAIMTSIALQYGVPLKALVDKFSHTRFEPSGFTQNPEIPFAKSVTDYVFRWLGLSFLQADAETITAADDEGEATPPAVTAPAPARERLGAVRGGSELEPQQIGQSDAPPCASCGSITVRAGMCYLCTTCGETGGCG